MARGSAQAIPAAPTAYPPLDHAAIGQRIADWRRERGLSQLDVAKAVEATQASISNYEGGRELRVGIACALAAFFGTTLEALLYEGAR